MFNAFGYKRSNMKHKFTVIIESNDDSEDRDYARQNT